MIPNTYNSIAGDKIEEIRFVSPSRIRKIPDHCLNDYPLIKTLKIPEGIESIGRSFRNWERLERLELPSTLIYISPFAFDGAVNLKTIICSSRFRDYFASFNPEETIELEGDRIEIHLGDHRSLFDIIAEIDEKKDPRVDE